VLGLNFLVTTQSIVGDQLKVKLKALNIKRVVKFTFNSRISLGEAFCTNVFRFRAAQAKMEWRTVKKPKVASFFTGIGGFDIGFEQADFDINFQCEIHQFCNSVLNYHWPKTPRAKDILKIDPDAVPEAEVWCGGFPCQDLSVARGANGRHGLNGSRSGLFFRLSELAEIKKPRVILVENVHGLLSSNNGKDFAELLYTLSSLNNTPDSF
jgi:hypothetical protein